MGRDLSAGLAALLATQNVLERFATVRIDWPQGVASTWAGTSVAVHGSDYAPRVIRASPLRMSQGAPVDRCEIVVANTDRTVSELLRQASFYDAAPKAVVGQVQREPRAAGAWHWVQFLAGELVAVSVDREEASLQIVSDVYAAGQVGAVGTTRKHCRWRYRDRDTCGYDGPLPTCSFDYAGPNGCEGHHNQHRFGGFIIDTDRETLLLPPPDIGGGGGGGGGGGSGGGLGGGDNDRYFVPDLY